jgi:hypothetical protein
MARATATLHGARWRLKSSYNVSCSGQVASPQVISLSASYLQGHIVPSFLVMSIALAKT